MKNYRVPVKSEFVDGFVYECLTCIIGGQSEMVSGDNGTMKLSCTDSGREIWEECVFHSDQEDYTRFLDTKSILDIGELLKLGNIRVRDNFWFDVYLYILKIFRWKK